MRARHVSAVNEVVQQVVGQVAVDEAGEGAGSRSAPSTSRKTQEQRERDRDRHRQRHHPAPRVVRIGVVHAVNEIGKRQLALASRLVMKRSPVRDVLEQRPDEQAGAIQQHGQVTAERTAGRDAEQEQPGRQIDRRRIGRADDAHPLEQRRIEHRRSPRCGRDQSATSRATVRRGGRARVESA